MIDILRNVYITGNMQNHSTNSQSGFTIVEMLIATAIFVVTLVLALDIFMIFVRDQFTEIQRKQVEDEMMYIFSVSTANLKHTTIDYSAYTTLPATDALYMNDNNEPRLIALGSHPSIGADSQTLYMTDYSTVAPLSGEHTAIETVQYYIYPNSDPFDTSNPSYTNNQPVIVMYIKASHRDYPEIVVEYQTMITSRFYGR